MKYIPTLFFLLLAQPLLAQLPLHIGKLEGVASEVINERYITRVDLQAENASVSLIPYSQTSIRIRAAKEGQYFRDFSYAVVQKPAEDAYFSEMKEQADRWILRTDSLQVEVLKNPLRIRFLNHKGELLNEDEPALGMSWIGEEVACYKRLQEGEKFVGLGEKTGDLDRRGAAYENWNTDDYGYEANADPLYVTAPFYMGLHNQRSYGIFFDNTHKSTFNFGASNNRFSSFSAVAGELNYYFFGASTFRGIIQDYTRLTGRMEMPPLWALGFQQCRWSYFPDKEVRQIAQSFRDKNIGGDVIYLDINYMDAYKIFTFHPHDFPKPDALVADLKKLGFEVVVIVDPGIKVEKGYKQYEEGLKNNYFLRYSDDSLYTGQVWPGWCHFPDFTHRATRYWWGKSFETYTKTGISGFWNDMNEPATWGQNFPNNVIFNWDGNYTTHREAHNAYGFQMTRATYEGAKNLLGGKRPFCLTRAAYSGIQRYSAVWTGDNVATDEHLLSGIRLLNSMGMTGIPFVGTDVGGFSGTCTPELYLRWLSIGAFTPFFRAHSQWGSRSHEPWAFGEDIEREARKVIAYRYKMLPYLYSVFYEAHKTGMPVMRSPILQDAQDEKLFYYAYQNQFLCGENYLIAPVESQQKFQKVYFPKGSDWYHLHTGQRYAGGTEVLIEAPLSQLPVFVRSGSLIPLQKTILSTAFPVSDTLEIHVYKGNNSTKFAYYEDDGKTFGYEKGNFYQRDFSFDASTNRYELSAKTGDLPSKYKYLAFYFHGFSSGDRLFQGQAEIQPSDAKPFVLPNGGEKLVLEGR